MLSSRDTRELGVATPIFYGRENPGRQGSCPLGVNCFVLNLKAPPGFEPGMKVLQTSGRHDASLDGIGSSCQVSDRSSLNLPFGDEIAADLAEIVDVWPQLPEALKSAVLEILRASRGRIS
jgi:hypothetical protein